VTQSRTDSLPPEVRRTLAAEGDVPAGEELVRFAERMARSRPGEARRWGARLARSRFDSDVVTGCARWAAGVAMYLSGDVNGAEPCLREAARRLSGAANESLADRARLLLVDLHGERFELGRARRLAVRLRRSFAARGDHERAAVAQINLASAEDAADRVARARDLWRGARSDLAEGSLRRLLTDGNLANVAALEGRFDDAAAGLRRVADEARSEGLQGLVAQAELNLAEVEFAAGRVDVQRRSIFPPPRPRSATSAAHALVSTARSPGRGSSVSTARSFAASAWRQSSKPPTVRSGVGGTP